jgi:hypothetical protein
MGSGRWPLIHYRSRMLASITAVAALLSAPAAHSLSPPAKDPPLLLDREPIIDSDQSGSLEIRQDVNAPSVQRSIPLGEGRCLVLFPARREYPQTALRWTEATPKLFPSSHRAALPLSPPSAGDSPKAAFRPLPTSGQGLR